MINANGMVAGQVVALNDAHIPLGIAGCLKNNFLEQSFIDKERAGESEDKAAAWNFLKNEAVDVLVSPAGLPDVSLLLGESRRVEDDEVIGKLLLAEELEDIGNIEMIGLPLKAIKLEVLSGQGKGFF